MKDIIRRHVSFVVQNPAAVLLASLLATAAIGLGVLRVTVDIDPAKLLAREERYRANPAAHRGRSSAVSPKRAEIPPSPQQEVA